MPWKLCKAPHGPWRVRDIHDKLRAIPVTSSKKSSCDIKTTISDLKWMALHGSLTLWFFVSSWSFFLSIKADLVQTFGCARSCDLKRESSS